MLWLAKAPSCLLLVSLGFSLVGAQTETVYFTQVQTIYTACECLRTLPTGSTMSLSVETIVSGISASSPMMAPPTGPPTTLTGTFPSFTALSISAVVSSTSPPAGVITSPPASAATIASAVSLSNGLAPLLASSPVTSTSISNVSSTSPAGSVGTGPPTSIQVLSSTLIPTAAFSELTTSGIPESLSVNPSLVTSKAALDSSAALISFGTTSPAVFSTVLPLGMSLGTSSAVLTTYSTVSLSSASLTGVTLLAPRSPTSCFTLPTPAASMDLIAIAVVPLDDFDLSNPVILSLGNNGTVPQYMSALASGNPYVLDLSPGNAITGQLGLQIPGEDALVFDGSGMSLYTGNCSAVTQVLVNNFYDQLGSMAGAAPPASASLARRQTHPTGSVFNVQVAVDTYVQTPQSNPNLTFGDSPCTFQGTSAGSATSQITWTCIYPPPVGGAVSCASALDAWPSAMNLPSVSPGNTTEVLATLEPFLSMAGDSVLDLFPGSDPALGLAFKFMRQVKAAASDAVGSVGTSACEVAHAFDSDDLVLEDSGPLGTQTLGSFMTAPPPSLVINLAATATAAIVALPPRKANPTDTFLKQIATDFKSIYGAFTHWLHGLPILGGLFPPNGAIGMQKTGAPPLGLMLTEAVFTTTSSNGITTSSVNRFDVPTVTVTHILGDGWFHPSIYTVGTGSLQARDSNAPVAGGVVNPAPVLSANEVGASILRQRDQHVVNVDTPDFVVDGEKLSREHRGKHVVTATTTITLFNATSRG
ncbi:hypothetical protein BD289DRAFT_485885 [Coniella lustricola]|uniref:Uncharacterized protein n=1 Tax=Coniella lustricola TaxID=2025994 RepID=A0A2T2ZX11_9PEZI|nr:hypothetical protein BD289DRAFT_485885 [Coniella lustricola]